MNRITAFMQPHSLPSGDSCRKRANISCIIFISLLTFVSSAGSLSRAFSEFSSGDRSQGMDHWAKCNRNNSFHDSCSSSNCFTDKTKSDSTSPKIKIIIILFKLFFLMLASTTSYHNTYVKLKYNKTKY